MRCPQCGYHSYDELTSCKKCGTDLPRRRSSRPPTGETVELFADEAPQPQPADDLPLKSAVAEPQESAAQERDWSAVPKKELDQLFPPFAAENERHEPLPWELDGDGEAERSCVRRRLLACMLDGVVLAVVWSAVVLLSLEVMGWTLLQWQDVLSRQALLRLSYYGVLLVAVFSYFPLCYYGWSRTLGHAVCGLQVVSEDGRPLRLMQGFFRTVGGVLSFLCGGLGFILALRSVHQRGWNDQLAGTRVVDEVEWLSAVAADDEEGE